MRRMNNPYTRGNRPRKFFSPTWKVSKDDIRKKDNRKFDPNWNKKSKPKRA